MVVRSLGIIVGIVQSYRNVRARLRRRSRSLGWLSTGTSRTPSVYFRKKDQRHRFYLRRSALCRCDQTPGPSRIEANSGGTNSGANERACDWKLQKIRIFLEQDF